MKLYEDFIDDIEDVTNKEELTNKIVNEFEEYPHIQQGIKSYIDVLFKDNNDDIEDAKADLIDLLNEIYNLSDDELDALDLAVEDLGPWYFHDTVDIINRGDYIFYPDVTSDFDLGQAYIDMVGPIEDAVSKDKLSLYINVDDVAEMFMRDNKDTEEDESMDFEDWYAIAEEEVENDPERFVDDFFDYEMFGRDLRLGDGYFIGDGGAIWIQ